MIVITTEKQIIFLLLSECIISIPLFNHLWTLGGDFDLFVGETGAVDSDFEFIPLNKTIFEKQMELYQYSNSSFFPNIHFSKTETENQ